MKIQIKLNKEIIMKKNCFFAVIAMFLFSFTIMFFSGCSVAGDLLYMKQSAVGVGGLEDQEEVEKKIRVKNKKRKINNVTVEQNVIYTPEIGYGSISKEERLKYSDKTDNDYGLFRYRYYYDYATPEVVMIFIDVDTNFDFHSAFDQSGKELKLIKDWPNDHLFNDFTRYRELYTIYLTFEYVKANKNKAIVIDLISDKEGAAVALGSAFWGEVKNFSRTFHIPIFYTKGFLSAIDKHNPGQEAAKKD